MDYSSDLRVKRNLLFGGRDHRYQFNARGVLDLSRLYSAGLEQLVPYRDGELIEDLKGRDPVNLVFSYSAADLPRGNELLFVKGTFEIPQGGEAESDRSSKGESAARHQSKTEAAPKGELTETVSFNLALHSDFVEFKGDHHIVHVARLVRSASLPAETTPGGIFELPALKVSAVRFGIDLYDSNFFTMLGFAPVVLSTALLEATTESLALRIEAERVRSPDQLPFQRNGLLHRLSQTVATITNFDIESDYRRRVVK